MTHLSRIIMVVVSILIVNFGVLRLSFNQSMKSHVQSKSVFLNSYFNNYLNDNKLDSFHNYFPLQQIELLREASSNLFLAAQEGLIFYLPGDSMLYKIRGSNIPNDSFLLNSDYNIENFKNCDDRVSIIKSEFSPFPGRYYANFISVGNMSACLIYIYSRDISSNYLGRYPMIMTLFITLLIVVMSWRIYRTNKIISKPYADIIKLIELNQDVKTASSSTQNEYMIIRRAIDLYHNQLTFYKKSLERASSKTIKFEKEIRIAKRLQKNILPKEPQISDKSEHVVINAKTDTFFDIGGDLYDYFMLDDEHMIFLIGDVSGKGIPAALFMIYVQTLLRSIVSNENNPGAILTRLNEKILEENVSDLFVTIFVGVLNYKTHELLYSNAAHNMPLLVESNGKIEALGQTHGIPVGIYENKIYSFSKIKINANSLIILYTDGVTDTLDENGMDYSVETLKYNLLGAWFLTPSEVVDKIQKSVELFRGNSPKVDDMTIMVMKVDE